MAVQLVQSTGTTIQQPDSRLSSNTPQFRFSTLATS